ncbi:MAG: hypothetical protein DHS20C11_10190 [Lysobacteraceae bacterium]|nr:MAG: hypothetical protein DHS20C11_10190 [Xanthomonadaceae bacterium]
MINRLRQLLKRLRTGEQADTPTIDAIGHFVLQRWRNSELRAENIKAIRSLCRAVYLGNSTACCRVLGRFPMFVDTDDIHLGVRLQMDGFWEAPITEWVSRAARPGKTMLDVGANYGYFTLLMAHLVGPDGKVWAFEPNPRIMDLLRESIHHSGYASRIKTKCVALDAKRGQLPFRQHSTSPMNAHLLSADELEQEHILVKTRTLDEIIPEGTQIDFIKVDIEGAERNFWIGAQRVIADNPAIEILMEVNYRRYDQPEIFFTEIIENGFVLREITAPSGQLQKVTPQQLLDPAKKGHRMLLLRRDATQQLSP